MKKNLLFFGLVWICSACKVYFWLPAYDLSDKTQAIATKTDKLSLKDSIYFVAPFFDTKIKNLSDFTSGKIIYESDKAANSYLPRYTAGLIKPWLPSKCPFDTVYLDDMSREQLYWLLQAVKDSLKTLQCNDLSLQIIQPSKRKGGLSEIELSVVKRLQQSPYKYLMLTEIEYIYESSALYEYLYFKSGFTTAVFRTRSMGTRKTHICQWTTARSYLYDVQSNEIIFYNYSYHYSWDTNRRPPKVNKKHNDDYSVKLTLQSMYYNCMWRFIKDYKKLRRQQKK